MTRIVFADTETTGLDADRCGIIQYCLAVWNDGEVTALAARKTMPWAGAVITPEACRVNGYNPATWQAEGATPVNADDVKTWHEYLNGAVVGGANVPFDRGFLAAECRRLSLEPPRWSHRNADITPMAMPLVVSGAIAHAGLAALVEYFGVGHERPHDAVSDVEATIAVFEALCDVYVFKPRQWREGLAEIHAKYRDWAGHDGRDAGAMAGRALGVQT